MNKTSNKENQWHPCEEGQIRLAGATIQKQQQLVARRQFLKKATSTAAAVGVGFVGWNLFGPQGANVETPTFQGTPSPYGGIACKSVVRLLPDYIALKIEDEKVVESIADQLAKCAPCRRTYEGLKSSMANLG